MKTPSRATFGTRFGFYMAAVGSACGLGTLWRFPYVTGVNGGGAFVLLYLFFVGAIALPALIAELMLGRETRKNIVGSMSFAPWVSAQSKRWRWVGRLGILASFVVLSYYTVVSGWVIHFIVQGITGRFMGTSITPPDHIIDNLLSRGYLQFLLAGVHLVITASIVAAGVRKGIERTARIFVPGLILIMLFLVVHSLFLPGSVEAMRFLFYPDFSKLTATSIIEALGHALFTVSLGFGAMITYGSYLKEEVNIPSEAVLVAGLDTLLSLCAGVLIFPIVFTAHVDAQTGPVLLFKTMPVLFKQLPLGYWVGIAFFVCLYFSALSASMAIFEGLVSYLMDQWKLKRPSATYVVAGLVALLALVSAFSSSVFKNLRLGERGLLELIDQVIINWTLPVVVLGLMFFIRTKMPEELCRKNFVDPKNLSTVRLYPTWKMMVKYIVPALIIAALVLQVALWFVL